MLPHEKEPKLKGIKYINSKISDNIVNNTLENLY